MNTLKKVMILGLAIMTFASSCKMAGIASGRETSKNESLMKKQIVFETKKNYDAVLGIARADFKPIFIDFYTDWCAPCKWMEQDVFNTPTAAQFYNYKVINYKVNAEKGQGVDLARKFKVNAYPTLIFVDPYGNEIERYVGSTSISKFMAHGERAVAHTENLKPSNPNGGK